MKAPLKTKTDDFQKQKQMNLGGGAYKRYKNFLSLIYK